MADVHTVIGALQHEPNLIESEMSKVLSILIDVRMAF